MLHSAPAVWSCRTCVVIGAPALDVEYISRFRSTCVFGGTGTDLYGARCRGGLVLNFRCLAATPGLCRTVRRCSMWSCVFRASASEHHGGNWCRHGAWHSECPSSASAWFWSLDLLCVRGPGSEQAGVDLLETVSPAGWRPTSSSCASAVPCTGRLLRRTSATGGMIHACANLCVFVPCAQAQGWLPFT